MKNKSADRDDKNEKAKIEDASEIVMLIRESCLVNKNECYSNDTENLDENIMDALKLNDNSWKDQDNDDCTSERKSNDHVWASKKCDVHLWQWPNNDVLIGGCFPVML